MTFVNDNGSVLDFNGDFAITKQAVSFFTQKIKGDVSINFNVDNNSVNREVLGYDGPQMLNQVAFTRQSFTLMRNGNPYARGFIVIQEDQGQTLNCFFISGNSNWISMLNGLITELDYSGVTNVTNYEMQLTSANVYTAMAATSGIIFPMVDWCYDLNKGNNEWFMANLLDIRNDSYQSYFEFYPCFYLKTLGQEIMLQNRLKISGNILQDKLYQILALTPFNGEMKRENINITTAVGTTMSTSGSTSELDYNNFTETADPESLFASSRYTANKNSKLIVTITIPSSTQGLAKTCRVRVKVGAATVFTATKVTTVSPGSFPTTPYTFTTTITSGQVLKVTMQQSSAAGTDFSAAINIKIDIPSSITVDDYLKPQYFLPPLSCLDIIKFIVAYFGCVVYYDEYSKTINVNIIEKLKEEDAADWSEYFQGKKSDYTIDSAANNYMRFLKSEDSEIKAYDKGHLIKYGEGNITTGNTLKETNELIKIPFAPSEFGISKNGDWLSNIPLVQLKDSGDPYSYTAIADDGSGLGNYTFTNVLATGQVVRIVDTSAGDIGYFIVKTFLLGSPSAVSFWGLAFNETSTGKFYPQERNFNTITPRLIVVKPETLIADFALATTYNLYDSAFTASSKSTTCYGYFCKQATGDTIDSLKANVAFDNPDIDTFTDPTVKDLYFRKIGRMLGNPSIIGRFLLPESVFQGFVFDRFIFIKSKDLTGYFWVDSIINYQDGNTPVEVKLLMI